MKRKGFNLVEKVTVNEEVCGFDELETSQTKAKPTKSSRVKSVNQIQKQESKSTKKARYPKTKLSPLHVPSTNHKLSIIQLVEEIFSTEGKGLKEYFNNLPLHNDCKLEILNTLTDILRSTSDAIEGVCPDNSSFVPEIQSSNNSDNILNLQSDLTTLNATLDLLSKFENELDTLLNAANVESNALPPSRDKVINDQASNYLSLLKGMNENCDDIVNLLSSVDDNVTKTTTTRSQLYSTYQMAYSENNQINSSSTKEIVKALQKT